MIIVSDTSPIINLAMIGHLDLLPTLFGKVILPQKVFEEITIKGKSMPGADVVSTADWIEVRTCSNTILVQSLRLQLDEGEAEAIVLAIELKSDLLLMDERLGRQIARGFELPLMGLLGIVKMAKTRGLVPNMKSIIDQLIQEAGFRVSDDLYRTILKKEDES